MKKHIKKCITILLGSVFGVILFISIYIIYLGYTPNQNCMLEYVKKINNNETREGCVYDLYGELHIDKCGMFRVNGVLIEGVKELEKLKHCNIVEGGGWESVITSYQCKLVNVAYKLHFYN